MGARHRGGTPFSEGALAEYVRCFSDPAAIRASCEDYRAAASVDLVHDEEDAAAGHLITAPLLALWGEHSFVGRHYDVFRVWRECAADVRGEPLSCDQLPSGGGPGRHRGGAASLPHRPVTPPVGDRGGRRGRRHRPGPRLSRCRRECAVPCRAR